MRQEFKHLLQRRLYITYDGNVMCSDASCECDDGVIDFPQQRINVREFLEALEKHWNK